MKKNGYFTPNANNRHIKADEHAFSNEVKNYYNLKPKTRYRRLGRLLYKQLKYQIRNSIQY